jgi:peptide/nickel transport system ATP-binding protein
LSTLDKEGWKKYRSSIGYIQQDPYGALPPFMSVQRILEEPMKINGIKDKAEQRRRIRQVLEEVKLAPIEDFLPKFPHMLSGGQQQRLVIARAMILEPRMLIADEPVSMLDASVRVEILQLLQALQRRHNLAILYITHDLSTVRYFSERIFAMYGGKIIEKSSTTGLLEKPLHPYTAALFEATSDPDAANLTSFKDVPAGEPPSLMNPPKGCRFHPRCRKIIKGLCDQEMPPEFWVREDHAAACWLYKDQV